MTATSLDKTFTGSAVRFPFGGRRALRTNAVEAADTVLRRAVLARLIADPLVNTGHIAVAARAGEVTLSGYVTSNAQKCTAIAATRRVNGVEQLLDDLRVAVPCPAVADPAVEAGEARQPLAAIQPSRAVKRFDQGDINPRTPAVTMAEPSQLRQAP